MSDLCCRKSRCVVLWRPFSCSLDARSRLTTLANGKSGPKPIPVADRNGIPRVESDRPIVVGEGVVKILLVLPRPAPGGVELGIVGIEPDRIGEVRDSLVKVRLGQPGVATVPVSTCVFGIDSYGFTVVGNRLV